MKLEHYVFCERLWYKRLAGPEGKQKIKDLVQKGLEVKAKDQKLLLDMDTLEFKEELIKESRCDDKYKVSATVEYTEQKAKINVKSNK